MARPLIIATGGEDPAAFEWLQSQLAERYARHYRIEPVPTPDDAGELLDRLAAAVCEGATAVQAVHRVPAEEGARAAG